VVALPSGKLTTHLYSYMPSWHKDNLPKVNIVTVFILLVIFMGLYQLQIVTA